jgi:hypothetical protein
MPQAAVPGGVDEATWVVECEEQRATLQTKEHPGIHGPPLQRSGVSATSQAPRACAQAGRGTGNPRRRHGARGRGLGASTPRTP